MTPVDPTLLKTLYRTAFRSFVEGLRERTWTLLVSKVTVSCPVSARFSDATDEDHDALEAGLAAFFGADKMREAPWVQAWANKSAVSYEEVKRMQYDPSSWHDVSRPPQTSSATYAMTGILLFTSQRTIVRRQRLLTSRSTTTRVST